MTAADVLTALKARYSADKGWVLLTEFGYGSRRADAIAFNLYRSHGYPIHGFEVKVSRSDWLRQLRNPGKSGNLFDLVDEWYLVCPDGVLKEEELPEAWGWYQMQAQGGLRLKRRPAAVRDTEEVSLVQRALLTSVMVRMQSQFGLNWTERERLLKDAREEGRKAGLYNARREVERKGYGERYRKLRSAVRAFDKASGLKVEDGWDSTNVQIGALVYALLESGRSLEGLTEGIPERLRSAARKLEAAQRLAAPFSDRVNKRVAVARHALAKEEE